MKKITKILLLAFVFRFVLSFVIWHPDINNHIDWGIRFWQYGPQKFFAPSTNVWSFTWPNQPPGTIYIFAGIEKLFEFVFSVFWWINIKISLFPSGIITFFESNLYPALLKLPSILSDLGIAYLIYKLLKNHKDEKLGILGAIIFLVNPVIWYNSAVWGQTDAIVNFFALLAFCLLLQKKITLSLVAFALSLYIKASLLIFAPIYLIVVLRQKYSVKQLIGSAVLTASVIGLLTLPFSREEPFGWLYWLYSEKVFGEQLHIITANAFNLWAAIAGIHERPETFLLGPLSYEIWGVILFTIAYLPTLYLIYKRQDTKSIIWALAISAFASFMLLTNMHDRYLYPLFPVLTILALLDRKLLLAYLSISLINLLNLYNFWWVPKIEVLVNFLSFGNRLMPRILGFINFGLFIFCYKRFLRLLKIGRI